jgi:hypothetical protein
MRVINLELYCQWESRWNNLGRNRWERKKRERKVRGVTVRRKDGCVKVGTKYEGTMQFFTSSLATVVVLVTVVRGH